MKATLEFNLPDDDEDFQFAVKGRDSVLVIWEIEQFVRNKMDSDKVTRKEYKTLESILEYIYEQRNDKKLPDLV